MDLEGLLGFLRVAGELKRIARSGWMRVGVEHPESVAEHSYRTALLAMLLADLEGLDGGRVVRMALLHDLAESRIGDLTPEEKELLGETHRRGEEEAMLIILNGLPLGLAGRYLDLWREYQEGKSPEARVVHQADRLEMILQALEYEEEGIEPLRLDHFWRWEGEGIASQLYELLRRKREARSA
jgi:putative hydrolase of HD superfamily